MKKALLLFTFIMLVFCFDVSADTRVVNEDPSFSFNLPSGFREFDPLIAHSDGRTRQYIKSIAFHSYNKGGNPESNNWSGIFVEVEKSLQGLARVNDASSFSSDIEVIKRKWRNCKVRILKEEKIYNTLGDKMLLLNVIIPLKEEPVQFKIKGDVKDSDEIWRIVDGILESFEGKISCNRLLWIVVIIGALAVLYWVLKQRNIL